MNDASVIFSAPQSLLPSMLVFKKLNKVFQDDGLSLCVGGVCTAFWYSSNLGVLGGLGGGVTLTLPSTSTATGLLTAF